MRATRAVRSESASSEQVHQAHHPGLAFDEGADRREVVVADDQVALPVSGFSPIGRGERPVVDGEHRLLEAAPSALLSPVRSAVIPPGA
jgi:hypothetical protein